MNRDSEQTAPVKKDYTPPKLRRLGSIRDLTFGASGSKGDASLLAKNPPDK